MLSFILYMTFFVIVPMAGLQWFLMAVLNIDYRIASNVTTLLVTALNCIICFKAGENYNKEKVKAKITVKTDKTENVVLGTDVEKIIDPESGGLIVKFKPTEEGKLFFENVKNQIDTVYKTDKEKD